MGSELISPHISAIVLVPGFTSQHCSLFLAVSDQDRVCLQSIKFATERSAGSRSHNNLLGLPNAAQHADGGVLEPHFLHLPDHAVRSGPRDVSGSRTEAARAQRQPQQRVWLPEVVPAAGSLLLFCCSSPGSFLSAATPHPACTVLRAAACRPSTTRQRKPTLRFALWAASAQASMTSFAAWCTRQVLHTLTHPPALVAARSPQLNGCACSRHADARSAGCPSASIQACNMIAPSVPHS